MGKYSGLKNSIRDHDMFGHVINLNFNRSGPSHNTTIGGCTSIFIKLAMIVYIFLNFKKLILKEDDSINLQFTTMNLDDMEPAEYADS
jgi:hypothetical protein